MKYTAVAFIVLLGFAMDALIFGFTAYEVFWRDQSGWWFALALFIAGCEGPFVYKLCNLLIIGKAAEVG